MIVWYPKNTHWLYWASYTIDLSFWEDKDRESSKRQRGKNDAKEREI